VTNKVRENDILTVSTFAGTGVLGYVDGPGNTAEFDYPRGIAIDENGNIYVAEYYSHSIRKISPVGFVTTLAGSGGPGLSDGMGGNAKFNYPLGLAVDPLGNVFVADESNHCVRKITPTGNVTTLAGNGTSGSEDGNRTIARLSYPVDVALDMYGNIYVAEKTGIRKISPLGVVSTLAGNRGSLGFTNGMGTSALFNYPYGIVVDYLGNVLVSDAGNHCIRKISPSGNVTTIAGLCGSDNSSYGLVNNVGTNARFYFPIDIDIDKSGNIYIADAFNHVIRKISPSNVVTTFAGSSSSGFIDGQLTAAKFYGPISIALSSSGSEMYLADSDNNRIRKIAIPLPGPLPICDTNSTWHHIALTYSGSSSTNLLTAYVDGSQISFTSASFAISSISTSSLRLGWNGLTPVNSAGELFSGSMSDIRIYNRSLSLSEITLLKTPPPTPTSSPTPSSSPTRTSSPTPSSSPTASRTQSRTSSSTSTTSQVTNLLTTTKDVNGTDSLSSLSLTTIILILVGSNILLGVCVLICFFIKIRNRAIVHPLSSTDDEKNEPKTLQEQLIRLRERKLKVLVDNADIVDTKPKSTRVLDSSSQGMVQSPPSSSSSSLQTTSAVPSYIHPNSNEELEKTMEFAGNVRVYHQLSKLRNKLEKKKKINSPESGV
jgi:sugar lactone lactonase YvrE